MFDNEIDFKKIFQKRTGLRLGKRLYSGDGSIYQLLDHPTKVVKVVYSYRARTKRMMPILQYFKEVQTSAIVKLHEIGQFNIGSGYGSKNYYYYVMDRLKKIRRNVSLVNRISTYICLREPIIKNESQAVKMFVKKVSKLKYMHRDIHGGNIMKSSRGSLKFVDLESFDRGD